MKYKLNRVGKWKLKIVKSLICASVKIHIFVKFKNPNPIKMGPPLRIFHLLMQWLTPFVWTKYLIASCNVYLKQEDKRNYYYNDVLIKTFGFFAQSSLSADRNSFHKTENSVKKLWENASFLLCLSLSLLGIGKVWIWRINFRESV